MKVSPEYLLWELIKENKLMYINEGPHTWNIPSVGCFVGVGRNSSGLDLFWPMQSKILTSFLFVAWALGFRH